MLLYVDKKKQKRKKIKVICFILTSIFIVLANIIHYKKSIHQTQNSLNNYQNIITTHNWFYSSDAIQIFTKKNKQAPNVIITPKDVTRENAKTIAYALSKIPQKTSVSLSTNLTNNQIFKSLIQHFKLDYTTDKNQSFIITDNIKEAEEIIYKEKLYPTFLTYKKIKKVTNNTDLKILINTLFPPIQEPETSLEKEISSLNEFVLMYKKDILDALSPNHKHSFTTHGFFLKNANICINYQHNKICEINNNYSLEKNIKNIIEKNIDKNISHINILTSLKEISTTESLENNDGIALIFENRTEVLLPHELKQLSQTDNPFYIIKNKMGINPDYTSSKMKYFKFKTLEIEINDNI
jgi:hypothetical protein